MNVRGLKLNDLWIERLLFDLNYKFIKIGASLLALARPEPWLNLYISIVTQRSSKWKPIKTLHLTKESFQNKNTSAQSRLGEYGNISPHHAKRRREVKRIGEE